MSQLCGCPSQRPGGENKEEVWPQALPVYFARAADLRAELLGIAGKGHCIADLYPQPLPSPSSIDTSPGFGGQLPATGDMIRTLFAPGEIKLAIQRFVFVSVH